MTSHCKLPNELMIEVASHCTPPTANALSRTCKEVRILAEKALHHEVIIKDVEQLGLVRAYFFEHPEVWDLVRELDIKFWNPHSNFDMTSGLLRLFPELQCWTSSRFEMQRDILQHRTAQHLREYSTRPSLLNIINGESIDVCRVMIPFTLPRLRSLRIQMRIFGYLVATPQAAATRFRWEDTDGRPLEHYYGTSPLQDIHFVWSEVISISANFAQLMRIPRALKSFKYDHLGAYRSGYRLHFRRFSNALAYTKHSLENLELAFPNADGFKYTGEKNWHGKGPANSEQSFGSLRDFAKLTTLSITLWVLACSRKTSEDPLGGLLPASLETLTLLTDQLVADYKDWVVEMIQDRAFWLPKLKKIVLKGYRRGPSPTERDKPDFDGDRCGTLCAWEDEDESGMAWLGKACREAGLEYEEVEGEDWYQMAVRVMELDPDQEGLDMLQYGDL